MMVVGAFNQVQQALRWFVDNTGVIADWRATLLRVMEFRQALIDLDRFEAGVAHIERDKTADGHLVLDNLVIASFRGRAELGDRHVDIAPGGRVLVTGKPGTGKSSLFLALAGLWNWGSGHIGLPADGDVMFLSQTPYLPDGTLRSALTYGIDKPPADSVLTAALKRVGLPQLASSLDRTESWQRDLGFTEQMRLSLARVLLLKPKWVVADDAINLADDAERQVVESIFTEELSGTGVLSISASPARNGFYGRVIPLVAHPVKARVQADAAPGEAVAQAAT
jgi:putative ATP-binding cassette transporter